MDRNQKMSVVVVSIAVTLLAVTAVTAHSWTSTPLYVYRMEQQSSKMHFLATEVNGFTYTAEKGYELNYDAEVCCNGENPLDFTDQTCGTVCMSCNYSCPLTCITCMSTCETCNSTCSTCKETCGTCWYTCNTCWETC